MVSMTEGRHVFLKIVHSLSTPQNKVKPKAPGSGVKGRASKEKIQSPTP